MLSPGSHCGYVGHLTRYVPHCPPCRHGSVLFDSDTKVPPRRDGDNPFQSSRRRRLTIYVPSPSNNRAVSPKRESVPAACCYGYRFPKSGWHVCHTTAPGKDGAIDAQCNCMIITSSNSGNGANSGGHRITPAPG